MEEKFSIELIKHTLSEEELKTISSEMAKQTIDRQGAEEAKKGVMSDFKARIDGLTADIARAARRVTTGYEHRDIKCRVEMDFEQGMVFYYRTDTGELAKERPMRPDERQKNMDFEE